MVIKFHIGMATLLSEEESQKDLNKALKVFKRYAKKLGKNLIRFTNSSIS